MIVAGSDFLYARPEPLSPKAMLKPLALSIALCLSLTGCQVFEKSKTWDTVMSVRPGDSFRQADPSEYYSEKLHDVLLQQGIEHYVVTYQYHYYTHQYDEAVGTRTAIVYRDEADPSYPWWLKDDRTATPFWLPNGDLNKQLSFYCRRPAEVIEQKHYPARPGGKEVVAPRRTTQARGEAHNGFASLAPAKVHVAERVQPVTKITPVKPAPAAHAAVTKIQHASSTVAAKSKTLPEVAASAPAPSHASTSWIAPAVIDPVQQANDPTPRDAHLEKLFRARNGTTYDPTSAVDRRKMEQLKHGLVGKETSGEHAFRRGVDGLPGF